MSQNIFNTYLKCLNERFPESSQTISDKKLLSQNLISDFKVTLPASVLNTAATFVNKIYEIKESSNYQEKLDQNFIDQCPTTPSILTCFDFHYTEEQGLKLIEINTNASLYLTSHLLYKAHQLETPDQDLDALKESFISAFELKPKAKVAIFDREPPKEGLYFEFLLFEEWLRQLGFEASLESLADIHEDIPKRIYNRFTDFYFEEPTSQKLKQAWLRGETLLSPNPREYYLLADKHRLMKIREELPSALKTIIPETKTFSEFESKEALWQERKHYFFKPGQSFGSKGVFRGKSISRKAFESLYAPDFMAQEYCLPGKLEFEIDEKKETMKYDLRFFTFGGKIQSYVARLYQGQATNMKTPHGGLAPILFNSIN